MNKRYIATNFLGVNIQHVDFRNKYVRFILSTFSAMLCYYKTNYGSNQNSIKYNNIVKKNDKICPFMVNFFSKPRGNSHNLVRNVYKNLQLIPYLMMND